MKVEVDICMKVEVDIRVPNYSYGLCARKATLISNMSLGQSSETVLESRRRSWAPRL